MKLLKKKRILTPAEVIQAEQNKLEQSFGLFTKLRNDIKSSIDTVKGAKVESEKRKASLEAQVKREQQTMELADAEIQAQLGLLGKIEEFIPNKEVSK